ncbi:hypothetical protein FHX15_002821 [Rhizobium sp. BK650]|uniref:hypothetical protein n=1 Tax=Rhizobium sp. BK650 TaxID=2586990 RepID=UPI0016083F3A|nr:hypothetical protein [Rhizobium sp. BK650]MBB3657589.1 hypothetical protein [Rhizobium sp. BK650]
MHPELFIRANGISENVMPEPYVAEGAMILLQSIYEMLGLIKYCPLGKTELAASSYVPKLDF